MPEHKSIYRFSTDPEAASIVRRWWHTLDKNRGDRADLRRVATTDDVYFIPAFHRLFWDLKKERNVWDAGVARVAGLLALVNEDTCQKGAKTGCSLPKQMGTPQGDRATVSELRFRRLLSATDADALFPQLARVVRSLKGQVDLMGLADAAYRWDANTRKEWAYAYYAVAPKNTPQDS